MLEDLERLTHTNANDTAVDQRFQTLMGANAWNTLKADVRRRFSQKPKGGESIVYRGVIVTTRMSRIGWFVAQLCRIVGAPLPLDAMATGTPAVVTVTEDGDGQGQFWSRTYGRRHGFPQVIHSAKRFSGTTGLEEYVGCGLGMALNVTEDRGGMVFTSAFYHWRALGRRWCLPGWMTPGRVTVRHDDLGDGYFAFTLELAHPLAGELVHQRAIFTDTDRRRRQ